MPPTGSSPTEEIKYLGIEQVLAIHEILIERYGGSRGIHNRGLLESAVFRPQASAFGKDAYPALFEKCAVLGYSLIQNHPFSDGNKRTGFACMHLILLINGYDLKSTSKEEIAITEDVASGNVREPDLVEWLKKHSTKKVIV